MRVVVCRWSHDQRTRLDVPHREGSRGTTVPLFCVGAGKGVQRALRMLVILAVSLA